jgi:hypothetical protein
LARHGGIADSAAMPIAAPDLPTDVAALQAMVLAHAAELAEIKAIRQAQDSELAAARAGIIEQRFEIEALRARLARLLRAAFGRSSEKLRDRLEQLELTLADIDELLAETSPPEDPAAAAAERGRAGPGPLAHLLVAKYCDHLPLHRQTEIYACEDIDLSRSTLADMVGGAGSRFHPA